MMEMLRILKKIFQKLHENIFETKWETVDPIDQQSLFKDAFERILLEKRSAKKRKIENYSLDALDLSLMIEFTVYVYETYQDEIKSPEKYKNLPEAMELLKKARNLFSHNPKKFEAKIWNHLDQVLKYFNLEKKCKQMAELRTVKFDIELEQVCSRHQYVIATPNVNCALFQVASSACENRMQTNDEKAIKKKKRNG